MEKQSKSKVKVFFSYAHEDYELCHQVYIALSPFKRQELLELWLDRKIGAGEEWQKNIDTHIYSAHIILLLISPDFFSSDFCWNHEVPIALARQESGEARVIPVVLRPCVWAGAEFGKFQALPSEGRPITSRDWESQDEALMNVAEGLRLVLDEYGTNQLVAFESSMPEKIVQLPQMTKTLAIWNIPIRRNRNFVGRNGLLNELKNSLKQERIQAIVGLGGIGKSQIAAEYAYQNVSQYKVVWWIDAGDQHVLGNEFAKLAKRLSLVGSITTDQGLMTKAVQRWLEQHENWLLIFDDAASTESVIPWLPKQYSGDIFITSRNPNFQKLANILQVPVLDEEDAIHLLQLRSTQEDREGAGELAKLLGYLPLAIEQAGAYLEETSASIMRYRDLFENRASALLTEGYSLEYENTVDATWELNITQVRERSLEADDILTLCAFLGAEAIPLSLLESDVHTACPLLSEQLGDSFILNRALATLRRFSLIEVKDNNISVNRLVQTVIRGRVDKDTFGQWAEGAVKIVRRNFVFDDYDPQGWTKCAQLLPHVLASSKNAEQAGVGLKLLGPLLNETGAYLRRRAQFTEAKTILERSRILIERYFDSEHEEFAKVLNNLGCVHRDLGKLREARDFFHQASMILDHLSDANLLLITDVLDNFGVMMERLEQSEQALEIFQRALDIHASLSDPDVSRWATCLNNSGMVFQKLGNLEEARNRYEQALKMYESVHGLDHPNIAFNLDKLAGVLQEFEDNNGTQPFMEEAQAHYRRAFIILETHFGQDHPQLGNLSNNLGNLLRKMRRFHEAHEFIQRALTINTRILGSDNPLVAMNVTNYGLLLRDQGEKEKATSLFQQAYDVFRTHWGEKNRTTKRVKAYLQEINESK